jgi:hypothetical protein
MQCHNTRPGQTPNARDGGLGGWATLRPRARPPRPRPRPRGRAGGWGGGERAGRRRLGPRPTSDAAGPPSLRRPRGRPRPGRTGSAGGGVRREGESECWHGETHGLTAQGGGSIVVAGRELAVVTAVLLLHLRGALKQSDTYHIMLAKHS